MNRIEILNELKNNEVIKQKFENIMKAIEGNDVKIKIDIEVVFGEESMFTTSEKIKERVTSATDIFGQYVFDEIETREREIQKLIERLK